jgi:hypothetical protein
MGQADNELAGIALENKGATPPGEAAGGWVSGGSLRYLFTRLQKQQPRTAESGRRCLRELEQILARSRAEDTFKSDVRAFCASEEAPRIRVLGAIPQVKVQRLLKQMLATEADLPIEGIAVHGSSGCSDFVGTVEAHTKSGTHVFDFEWCCRWRAQQQGWTDCFGFPDQLRAAQEYDWRCFRTWTRRTPSRSDDHPGLPFSTLVRRE